MVDVELIRESNDRLEHPRFNRLLWFYVALVAIHLLSGTPAEQPIVLADELGYLGNARYIAGTSHLPDLKGAQLYHFGYSICLVPAFWLFDDPIWTYKAAIAVNALLASALIVPLYFVVARLMKAPARTARWVAFTCCLYPPLIFHSSIVWSENLYTPLYVAAMALFGRFLGSRRDLDAVLFGIATGFLYTVHPRGLPVIAGVLVTLVVLAVLRSVSTRAVVSAAAAVAVVSLPTRLVLNHLKRVGWASRGEELLGKLVGRIVPDGDLPAIVERMAGQLLYLAQATQGLFLLGLFIAVVYVARRVTAGPLRSSVAEPATGTAILALVTSAAVFLASCVSKLYSLHGPDGVRADNLIYGRYNEAAAILIIAVAIAWLCHPWRRGIACRWRVAAVLAIIAVIALLTVVVAAEVDDALARHVLTKPGAIAIDRIPPADIRAPSVAGIYPFIVGFGGLDLFAISATAILAFVLVISAMKLSERLGLGLIIMIFLTVAVANRQVRLVPAVARAAPRLAFASQLSSIGPIATVSYDDEFHESSFFGGLQYLTPQTVYTRFDSANGELPVSEAVLSGNEWLQASDLGAKFYMASGRGDHALWLMPGKLRSRIDRWGPAGEVLGGELAIGVRIDGFGPRERNAGRWGRWTDGAASLLVNVDRQRPPLMLGIDVAETGRDGSTLELRANGVTLWSNPLPKSGGAATFSLENVPIDDELTIEILSDTMLEAKRPHGQDQPRNLGVFVNRLRLDGREDLAAAAAGGLLLGSEKILGYPETGFYGAERQGDGAARWTNGAARLRIPLHPSHLPDYLEVTTVVPERDGAKLAIRANGVVLWSGRIPSGPWSRSLPLADVPDAEELLLELESDTFCPAETIKGSTDSRILGVKVRSIRLTVEPGTDSTD